MPDNKITQHYKKLQEQSADQMFILKTLKFEVCHAFTM